MLPIEEKQDLPLSDTRLNTFENGWLHGTVDLREKRYIRTHYKPLHIQTKQHFIFINENIYILKYVRKFHPIFFLKYKYRISIFLSNIKCTHSWRLRLSIHSRNCICTLFTSDLYLSNNRPVHLPIWFQQGEIPANIFLPRLWLIWTGIFQHFYARTR